MGQIGVAPSGKTVKLSFVAALSEGVRFTLYLTKLVVVTLVKLVKMEISAKALSGPITIVQASGESLKAGVFSFIFLMSYISINLAIINLLPVPILDGGHLHVLSDRSCYPPPRDRQGPRGRRAVRALVHRVSLRARNV